MNNKKIISAIAVLLAVLMLIGLVVTVLPASVYADTEVSTNVALNVNAARLERLTFSVAFESCETNEVLVALVCNTGRV